MDELLSSLAGLTLGGSGAILFLALTTRLSRARYAARWRCWVWALLCLRLCIPLSVALPEENTFTPPIQIAPPRDTVIYSYIPAPVPPQPTLTPGPGTVSSPDSLDVPAVPSPARSITAFDIVGTVWLAGSAARLGGYILSHLRFLAYLRRWGSPVVNAQTIRLFNELGDKLELNRRPALYCCTGLQVPVLVGLVQPKLLLPEGEMSETAMRHSLLHELTHFKRRDIWLKTLALLANAIHWFNPLMWYMTRLVERDTELACDEAALNLLPPTEHSAYGTTILDAVARMNASAGQKGDRL